MEKSVSSVYGERQDALCHSRANRAPRFREAVQLHGASSTSQKAFLRLLKNKFPVSMGEALRRRVC